MTKVKRERVIVIDKLLMSSRNLSHICSIFMKYRYRLTNFTMMMMRKTKMLIAIGN